MEMTEKSELAGTQTLNSLYTPTPDNVALGGSLTSNDNIERSGTFRDYGSSLKKQKSSVPFMEKIDEESSTPNKHDVSKEQADGGFFLT